MSKTEAISEVFITAFKSLPRHEKETILQKMLKDLNIREDIMDIIIAVRRQKEKSISYEKVRDELRSKDRL